MNVRAHHACRLVVAVVFVAAGVMKVVHPATFFSDLLSYQVPLPEIFLRFAAVYVPWFEVIAGLALLLNFWPETIRPVVSALCAIFVLMLGQAVVRGLDLNCGCFGAGGHGWFERPDIALVRAGILLAVSLSVTAWPPQPGGPV